MYRYRILFAASFSFALLTTLLLLLKLLGLLPFGPPVEWGPHRPFVLTLYVVLAVLQSGSVVLAPLGWAAVIGVWIWRGRMKSEWTRLGLDRDSFRLLLQMKGSNTRTTILKSLLTPKDRFQLSKELDLDWTTIDYHVQVLLKHDLISERTAFGSVKLYQLTATGSTLLRALEDMNGVGYGSTSKKA